MQTVTMTASITHYLKSAPLDLIRLCLCLCLLAGGMGSARAQSVTPEVLQLRVARVDEAVYLSANLQFELSSAVEDALLKGVAMFFVAEADVLLDRWYWTRKKVMGVERHMRLMYQPLTRRWRLSVASGKITSSGLAMALNQNFDSLPEALSAMQRLSRWKIIDGSALDPEQRYVLEFSFRLDASQLPRPLQIGVLGQSDWIISLGASQPLEWDSVK